jgi:DNA-binding LacI/PurR family transcriptional regulator
MKKNANIRDVARLANVSVATVSRILNNKPDVSEETRQKVLDVIGELGYARSMQWKQITSGRSNIITLHYPYKLAISNQVSLHFITGVTRACEEHGYSLHLVTQSLDENRLLDFYRTNQSDGLILMEIQTDDWRVELLRQQKLPFVMIGRREKNDGVSFVDFDFESAMNVAVHHLVDLGHRNIAFVSVITDMMENHYGPSVRALNGYEMACAHYRIPKLYCETENGFANVKLATLNIMRKHPEVTAIVTIFDTAMAGISSAINSLGLKVPDDVSFVGLGDEQGTELTSPSLTVLDFPASFMGYEAAKILLNELEKGTKMIKQILVEPKLVIRSSTGLVRNTV